ncbi:MAG: integrase arm-type DNA-binding domain-containing protein [Sterolibacteriaceae bacterium]|uniref:Integrase arm-type DNA-binding domain-containing protein n=1 Tax=Candidatus Methylophosphatis roskildensis TaxID=2899263 RepID=A0A9D7DYQ0_9PROT|nr:integrase arm-type DNA-binding domain-containing protein [Candidatus Methylophosphatis roskildensis]MBK7238181.1 integrase arm-type DNA-binding domain-containing protein [Sterolibacteriaceae bacterium]
MGRTIQKLTPLSISRATKPGLYGDGAGLYLQIGPTGGKSWLFRFMLNGKAREMGLGPQHTIKLPEARAKAAACRRLLLDGKDPIEERKATTLRQRLETARAATFKLCAERYIASHRTGWKNAKHASQWENTLGEYVFPIIGDLPVAAVDTSLVMKCLLPIWTNRTETATRVRGRIESILDWATVSNYRQGENPARWRGHLDKLLPRRTKVAKVKHHSALPYSQISTFVENLRTQNGISARALEFTILTAARSGEVRGARRDEFDLNTRMWTIPAARMKADREHCVPLSNEAVRLIEALPRFAGTDLLFPGSKSGKPLSDMSLTAVIRRMDTGQSGGDRNGWRDTEGRVITAHGFRSAFRDWAGETTSFPREVIEHALAHQLKDKAEAAYARGTLFDKRRHLMSDWAKYCGTKASDIIATPKSSRPVRAVKSVTKRAHR